MEQKIIREVFPIAGMPYFFTQLYTFLGLSSDVYTAEALANEYFLGHSGAKLCSPFLINLLGGESSVNSTISQSIFEVLRSRFGEKWRRLYATTIADYNPIHNYDMSEQEHRELSGQEETDNSGTSKNTTNHGMSNTTDELIYGFNSSEAQPSSKHQSQNGGSTVVDNNGTFTENGTNSETEDITRTRAGNIGVTTTQQMLQQERELWMWNFVDQLYADIDIVLALKIYDICRV